MQGAASADRSPSFGKTFLYIIAFASGMTTLAVELSASRLLGNVFGSSNLVWANVIGLMLLYLTLGYFIGGRWADRSPKASTLLQIVLWAAFLSTLIPIISRPVLSRAAQAVFGADAALALGSFISVLVLFSVPVTLLGTVSPFVIRLAVTRIENSGRAAGQVYAISTLGSLVGTFLPVLLIIPELGTMRTFLLFGGVLFALALVGLAHINRRAALRYLWMPVVTALLAAYALNGPLRPPAANASLKYERESAYHYIQVQEDEDGFRYLYLNEGQGIHSQWHETEYFYGGSWDLFLTGPYFNPPPFTPEQVGAMLVIGLAAGTIPRQYTEVYGNILIDGIEIDDVILEVGAKFFEMNKSAMPGLNAYAGDGRYLLNQLDRQYSIIAIDAYRPPYIPWHLTTVEFFGEVREHLTEDGVVMMNVGRTDTDRRLVDALAHTLSFVYPSVHAMDVPNSFNTVLVATMQATQAGNLLENMKYAAGDAHPALYEVLAAGAAALTVSGESEIVFTDDRAPVETLVDSIVLNFLLAGRAEEFRLAHES